MEVSAPSSSSRLQRSGQIGPPQSASLKKLKSDLKDALKSSGVLDSVKAQIRKEFISSLNNSGKVGRVLQQSFSDSSTANNNGTQLGDVKRIDLKARLALCSAYHMMKKRGMVHSLSVFAAESGLDSKAALLSEADIVASLNVNGTSPLYKAILAASASLTATQAEGKENVNNASSNSSVLELMFEHCFSIEQKGGRESSTQTDAVQGETPREALDEALKSLRSSYLMRVEADRTQPNRSAEERMMAFQRECDARATREMEMQMAAFRDTEIGRIRLEESERARLELQKLRNEMESEHIRRTQQQSDRNAEEARVAAERDRNVQQAAYDTRQRLQRELDEMRSREQATGRKMELDAQALRTQELRLKETQAMLEARETALSRREREAERKLSNTVEIAREEARTSLRAELDALIADRGQLALDRRRLAEDRSEVQGELEAVLTLRSNNKDLRTKVKNLDEEIISLQRKISKQDALINGSETEAGRNQLLVFAKRNTELEARLIVLEAAEKDLKKERALRSMHEGASGAKQAEIDRLTALSDLMTGKFEKERELADTLRRELQAEKLRGAASSLRAKESEQLLDEKRKTIASLMRGGVSASANTEHQSFGAAMTQRANKAKAEDLATRLILRKNNSGPESQLGTHISQQMYGAASHIFPPPGAAYMYPSYFMPQPMPAPPAATSAQAPPPFPSFVPTETTPSSAAPYASPAAGVAAEPPAGAVPSATTAVGSNNDNANLESLRADLERQRVSNELEALKWEKAKIERQRALYQEEEALERARLEAEAIRLGAEKLELQRRKQTFVVQQEMQAAQTRDFERRSAVRAGDELLDRPLPAAEAVLGMQQQSSVSGQYVALADEFAPATKALASPVRDIVQTPSSPAAAAALSPRQTVPSVNVSAEASNLQEPPPRRDAAAEAELARLAKQLEDEKRLREQEREQERQARARAEVEAAAERRAAAEAAKELARLKQQEEAIRRRAEEEEAEARRRVEAKRAEEERKRLQLEEDERQRVAQLEREKAEREAAAAALLASKSREEIEKIESDRKALDDARAKVLARRAQKKEREDAPAASSASASASASSARSVPSPTRAAPKAPTATQATTSTTVDASGVDSDVEITTGAKSDDEQDGGWF